mgnify:CR=1 FL=1
MAINFKDQRSLYGDMRAGNQMPMLGDMQERYFSGDMLGDDLRDPIGSINRLRQANQPIPESLQRAAFQFAGANNLDTNQLAERLGVSASDISQTAQNLGIHDLSMEICKLEDRE